MAHAFGAVPREMLEQFADGAAQAGRIAWFHLRRLHQTLTHFRLVEMEDQVVGAQARHVTASVKAL